MMTDLAYVLNTEVKGKNIRTSEHVANFFLTPVHYLWNGKKIDFIQRGDQRACQVNYIFAEGISNTPEKKTLFKVIIAIICLIPGVLIGGAIKTFAICTHSREDKIFMKKCLKLDLGVIRTPKDQTDFGNYVKKLIATIGQTDFIKAKYGDGEIKNLFLSEVNHFWLYWEKYHPNSNPFGNTTWVTSTNAAAVDANRVILNGMDLLWNLSGFTARDHYLNYGPLREKEALQEMNPVIENFNKTNLEFDQGIRARAFLKSLDNGSDEPLVIETRFNVVIN